MAFALSRAPRRSAPMGGAVIALALLVAALALVAFSAGAKAREIVAAPAGWAPGQIVIRQSERRLYFVAEPGLAIRYPVGVGKAGKAWFGASRVDGKYVEPAWSPPREVKRDLPHLPDLVPGGSPHNPMGARALTLAGGQYAIHGTTRDMRRTVGTAASYGCIRMLNEDVIDLYDRVRLGASVTVVP
jgi:lipoprotein-anchoring transpeptidase ErfK/SrfK